MGLIELTEVRKVFGKNDVLFNNLSLTVEAGEYVGLIGKSGAGKTTLLNIMGLITAVNSGTVSIGQSSHLTIGSRAAMLLRRHTIGYLFQNYGLIDDETVGWNLNLALEYSQLSRREKRLRMEEQLDRLGIRPLIDKKVYQLSGGEQQRVAIIKLILQQSQIILADEPTSGLDLDNERAVMGLLRDLNQAGVTIVMVTHNLDLRAEFSRIIDVDQLRGAEKASQA